MPLDSHACYRAIVARDARFDGQFVTGVETTGIYCRPACPSRTPRERNTRFFSTAAAAQSAGFRACRRCLPDAAPGSPEWNRRADTVGAAMRLIGDGVVDREGVAGLARRLGYTQRHLARLLIAELGASPIALARARRADAARTLLTATTLPASEVAFAAGFSSIRQFNDTIREVYTTDPTTLRRARRAGTVATGPLTIRLPVRAPFDGPGLLSFLARRAIDGVEAVDGRRYARTLRLPGGAGTIVITFPDADPAASTHTATHTDTARTIAVPVELRLAGPSDLTAAVARCRRLLDADADPVAIDATLSADPALAPAVARAPGIRLPGTLDGFEILVRAIVGQQVSVAAARTALGKLTRAADERIIDPYDAAPGDSPADRDTHCHDAAPGDRPPAGDAPDIPTRLTHLFPGPDTIAAMGAENIAGPRRRAETLAAAAADAATGALDIHPGRRHDELTAELVARRGIGPWTAGYTAMRVLGDPDVLLTGDLALRHGAASCGLPDHARELAEYGRRWAPFRSYAGMHLWRAPGRDATAATEGTSS